MNLLNVAANMDAGRAVALAIRDYLNSEAGERAINSYLPDNSPATLAAIYTSKARAFGAAMRNGRRPVK